MLHIWREQTSDIIKFKHFERDTSSSETNSPSETCNDAESGDKPDDDSIMPPLVSEEEMDVMDSGDESDNDLIST